MLGTRLKEARLRSGMSQETLAAGSGVSQPMISELETGRVTNPTLGTLRRLAEALGIGVEDLVGDGTRAAS